MCFSLRCGGSSSAGESGEGPGGGDEWGKLHLSPRPRRRIPQPHCDHDPGGEQDCHTERKIPSGRYDKKRWRTKKLQRIRNDKQRQIKICCVIGGDWRIDVTEKIRKMVGEGNKMGCGPGADSVQQIR